MSLDDFRDERLKKLKHLRDAGLDPYPARTERTHGIAELLHGFDTLESAKTEVTVAGRVRALRSHGGLTFLDIDDGSGSVQALIGADRVGQKAYDFFIAVIDMGDFVQVAGTVVKTKRGERSIEATGWKMLTKGLLPLPEKWHGLENVEERLRSRYVDLVMRPEERLLFERKSRFWQATREFLMREGGLEVETPILERIPGGADAEPFITHMNALNIDLFLRISPELNLKRLIVGGFRKVFEIGRIFRNEGIDREHLQDYTSVEMYWAYTDYEQLMTLVEKLVRYVVRETLGNSVHTYHDQTVDWDRPWSRTDYYSAFKQHTGLDLSEATEKQLKTYAEDQHIDTTQHKGRGRLIDIVFKKKVRPHLDGPGFLVLPPVDIEPLAKRWTQDPERVERFQIVACGSELGKGFSELNDPVDQRGRFQEQVKLGEAGDKEAQRMDEDYVRALEYGMPPTAGFSYSERLFSFLMDRPIRETVFFPLTRPQE